MWRRSLATGLSLLGALVLIPPEAAWPGDPGMSALWPNEDGLSWEYDHTYEDFLGNHLIENTVVFTFNGVDVVPGGIEVQNLEVDVIEPGSGGGVPAYDPVIAAVWRARPDLRAEIEARYGAPPEGDGGSGYHLLFLHEAAYRKTDEEVAAWRRDLEALRSWLWLVSDLTIGNQFELRLVPDLAPDVFLYGTIAAWEDVVVPAGYFVNCLRVDYVVDYGELICTDEFGNETGGFRSETVGAVHYAPDTGPVRSFEEFIPFVEVLWGVCAQFWPEGEPSTRGSLELSVAPPIPARRMSWGRIKASPSGPRD